MSSIDGWLERHGLAKYSLSFVESDIDMDVLHSLTDEDLKDLGLSIGDRRRFFLALEKFGIDQLPGSTSSGETSVSSAQAEHRHLTILFSDMVGSTELSVSRDPEAVRGITRRYQDIVSRQVERFGGYVARYMGDGVLAYFGYPQAHEDDPLRAIKSGLAVIEAVACDEDSRIQVRIGIETGPVVVGDVVGEGASRESPVVGETPNLAARIQGIAKPDTIVIGPGCHSRLDPSIRTVFLGAHDLRGFPRPVGIWQVTGSGPQGDRFDTSEPADLGRFVGRGAELELLFDCWSRAKEGNATLVQVSGDPGIGKSRLVYEFLNTGRENATLLRGHCSSHGASTAFLPFRDLLHRRCGLSDDLSSGGISEKIAAAVQDVDVDQRHTPYLLKLFGITAPEIVDVDMELAGIRTREAIVAFLLAHARFRPTVLFVNDLHWIDDSSDILLSSLARQADKSPILFLSTARPEYQAAWADHPSFTRISLSPLSPSETTILLRESLKGSSIDAGQLEMILDRAGGNPLFVEELARHAVEQRRTPGSSPAKEALPVPDTLEGLLLQRVDKLSPQSRRLLQAASVAGRRFRSDLVASVVGLQETGGVMEELESQGLVRADVSAGGAIYRFRHALVHDAVNASLLKSDRRTLHRSIGAELQTRHAGRETEICEELARHFIGAEDSEKSAAYCAMAGDKALGLFAINDARQWYAQSLDHVASNNERGDDKLLGSVLVNQLEVLCFDADSQGMVALAETHLPRVAMMGETAQVSRTYSWLGEAYLVMARFTDAAAALEKALVIAKKLDDPVCIGYAAGDLLWLRALTAGFREQEEPTRFREILEISDRTQIPYLRTLALYASALDLVHAGELEKARALTTQLIEFGRDSNYPPAVSWGHSTRAIVGVASQDSEKACIDAREAVRHASCQYDRIMAESIHALALVLSGELEEGLAVIERVRPDVAGRGVNNLLPMLDMAHGILLVQTEGLDRGLSCFADLQSRLEEQENKRALCALEFVIGELLLAISSSDHSCLDTVYWARARLSVREGADPADAKARLERAIRLAEEANMKFFLDKARERLSFLGNLQERNVDNANPHRRRTT